jgi:hypothetical protein
MVDTFQRSILFLDVLRQRGNAQIAMEDHPSATVLRFAHEVIMSGKSLPRPMNYSLWHVLPPKGGTPTNPLMRPVVVTDPRAGEGPGIGGFKAVSEIGDALEAGHPVYLIGFSAIPEPGQQFLDVVEGQVAFFERVAALHPDAPRPFAIGNCQAGYQTLMVAMLRPDLFGPCLLAGSPMSFWQGTHGKNPMRYMGGLSGGSWLTALTSDLGHGIFDGAWLVLNFDNLGPANWLWGKQYGLYAAIDTDAERYLEFEKWWGDFVQLGGPELQFLVDNLFIHDKLLRNELRATDGTVFDVRRVTSPIIVFTSTGDNISPPPQSLGWIADVYRDVDDIRASGQTIIYCLGQDIGHLALFVSGKVGAEQDQEFIRLMDVIDCVPPGLYELVISPRPPGVAVTTFDTGDWIARFEPRTLDAIRAIGHNSEADDRAFAAVALMSERNLSMYRLFLQPWMRAMDTAQLAASSHALNPLRLSYTMLSDRNPWMKGLSAVAASVSASRQPVAADNPLLAQQTRISNAITASLDNYRVLRDDMVERMFFGIYGSPVVQSWLGLAPGAPARKPPGPSLHHVMERQARIESHEAKINAGGMSEALTRAVMYVVRADGGVDQRCALAMNAARQHFMRLSLGQFKTLVRDQFLALAIEPERAIAALATMVPEPAARRDMLAWATAIVSAAGLPSSGETRRLDELARLLGTRTPVMATPAAPQATAAE